MTEGNGKINMSLPKNRNVRHSSRVTELSGPAQNKIYIENLHSPKKEKGNIHVKNKQRPPDHFDDVGHNSSLPDDTEKSCLQTSSNFIIKELSYPKELVADITSSRCVESTQYKTSDISYTEELTRQENQDNTESPKEQATKNPSKEKEENIGQLNCQMLSEYKNFEGSSNEVQTTTEMCETLVSLPLKTAADTSVDNAVDKKKERRKKVKQLAKDEKRKQRELEYKKNLQYPKGQRIQVIDHNTFHKILKEDGSLHSEYKRPVLTSEEFPALHVLKNNRFPVTSYKNFSSQSDTEKSQVQDKATNNVRESTKMLETHSVVDGGMVNKAEKKLNVPNKLVTKGSLKKIGKLPKKRDPIQIDILQCIKMVKSKDAVVEPRKKLSTLERRNDSLLISGNELDSSNPQRSRGKKREHPKKKRPTRLKLIILHERELKKQLEKIQESELPQTGKACFGTEASVNLSTAEGINSEQAETVTIVPESEGVKVEPGSMNLLTVRDIKLEQVESVTNVSVSKVVEAVPGSTNLLTSGAIKLEPVESVNNASDRKADETVPGSTNLLTAGAIKTEQVEPVADVSDNEVIETVPQVEDISKDGREKCEMLSSESKSVIAIMNQCLNAEDNAQIHLLNSQHVINNQPHTNDKGKFSDFMPSLLCSVSEILKKENQEFKSSVSSCSANLKRGQHSVATAGDDMKSTHSSSNGVKYEILNSPQTEHCADSLQTVRFTDQDAYNKLHQLECRKFPENNSSDHKETTQQTIIHSRKFRPYCDHFLTPEINNYVSTLLKDIVKFHDRQFERDPVKANARRRHVTGLREVLKYLNLKRLKLIIIAPDLELIQGKGGICDIVEQLKEGAQNQEIPYAFALHRRALGKITFKKVPVSCVGIINYDGTEKNFHSLVAALQVARAQYQEALTSTYFKDTQLEEIDINKQVIEAALSRLTENGSTSCSEESHFCSETVQKWEE